MGSDNGTGSGTGDDTGHDGIAHDGTGDAAPGHFDVVIIGAGLSGIGAACHLERERPGTSYVILEARDAIGGTWDLFRYPGIRSDSDMYTLGYNFKPWTNPKAIADGPSILEYIRDTAAEYDVERHIRFGHKVRRADWSTDDARWTIAAEAGGEPVEITGDFVIACTGYYNYERGHDPDFTGRDRFEGTIIHPQFWPEDLDYAGKQVVIIGSGATAVTLLPAMADTAAHVTMLQRSPTYVITLPEKDVISNTLRRWLPETLVYRMARARNIGGQMLFYQFARRQPARARRLLEAMVRRQVGPSVDMADFTPTYNPWDERVCAVPDGDLFRTLRQGKGSVVTDTIDTFTETGIRLTSGRELPADIIITATGLEVLILGGMEVYVDGERYNQAQKMNYKGVMMQDLPNAAMVFGYTNSSWTLKADITIEYLCRVLARMQATGARQVTPRQTDPSVHAEPFTDMTSGYLQRAKDQFPQQGSKAPWRVYMNFMRDWVTLNRSPIDDGVLEFSSYRGSERSDRRPVAAPTR